MIPFTVGFLIAWLWDANSRKIQTAYEFAKEASHALQRPTFRQVGRLMVAPVKVVPVGARFSRDLAAIILTSAKDGWRKVCQPLEYEFDISKYEPDGPSTLGAS